MSTPAAQTETAPVKRRVKGISLGPFDTNCYIVTAADTKDCWIIDPGFEPGEAVQYVQGERLQPAAVILTHAHLDHVAGLAEVLGAFPGIPVLGHESERDWPGTPELNLSAQYGIPIVAPGATRFIGEGETLRLGEDAWRVLHTPGHSPGSLAFVNDVSGEAVVGDTLFAGSIGRTDFPRASFAELERSIREKLYTLPDSTVVYPGHGPATTIGREKRGNPFVRP